MSDLMKKAVGIMLSSMVSLSVFAGNDTSTGYTITKIVVDSSRYAGCMVAITPGPETVFSVGQRLFLLAAMELLAYPKARRTSC
jgi:hypothetical protein